MQGQNSSDFLLCLSASTHSACFVSAEPAADPRQNLTVHFLHNGAYAAQGRKKGNATYLLDCAAKTTRQSLWRSSAHYSQAAIIHAQPVTCQASKSKVNHAFRAIERLHASRYKAIHSPISAQLRIAIMPLCFSFCFSSFLMSPPMPKKVLAALLLSFSERSELLGCIHTVDQSAVCHVISPHSRSHRRTGLNLCLCRTNTNAVTIWTNAGDSQACRTSFAVSCHA